MCFAPLLLILVWTQAIQGLDTPYSVVLGNLSSEVSKCSSGSGFAFGADSVMTALQASKMCRDSDCSAVASQLLALSKLKSTTATEKKAIDSAFQAFAAPMLDFCWYYRLPGAACPPNPVEDFISHYPSEAVKCEKAMNLSFLDLDTASLKLKAVKIMTSLQTCTSECAVLSDRLYILIDRMLCPLPASEGLGDFRTAVGLLFSYCTYDPSRSVPLYNYQSGWAVPPIPDVTSPHTENSSLLSATTPSPTKYAPTKSSIAPTTSSSGHDVEASSSASRSAVGSNDSVESQISVDAGAVSSTSPPSASTPPSSSSASAPKQSSTLLIVLLVASAVVLSIVLVLLNKRRGGRPTKEVEVISYSVYPDPSSAVDCTENGILPFEKVTTIECILDIRLLGAGGHASVFLVRDTQHDRLLASKRLANPQVSDAMISSFIDEIELVATLSHPCIVSFVGATWTHRRNVQALFEYMDGGDLRSYLDKTPVRPWDLVKLSIAINIAEALAYVHSIEPVSVVHRDLKSRNVLLTKPPIQAKLSDFGVARHLSHNCSMTTGVGTSLWLAPEVVTGGGNYTAACDVYSFGVVLTELDTHRLPFSDMVDAGRSAFPEITIMSKVVMDGLQPTLSTSCPAVISQLAKRWC